MKVIIDDEEVWQRLEHYNSPLTLGNLCFGGWGDYRTRVDFVVPHISTDAVIKITSSLNQNYADESWGLSDVVVTYLDENKDCPSAYRQCDAQYEVDEDEHLCSDVGEGWIHVRHVHTHGNAVFRGVPRDDLQTTFDDDFVNFQEGIWTIRERHTTTFRYIGTESWSTRNFRTTFKVKIDEADAWFMGIFGIWGNPYHYIGIWTGCAAYNQPGVSWLKGDPIDTSDDNYHQFDYIAREG